MIIIGAKGFAKEVLEIFYQLKELDNIVLYDDVNDDIPEKIYDRFAVLKSIEEVSNYLCTIDTRFTIGIGNPLLRKKVYDKFINLGGKCISVISPYAKIGHFGNDIGLGANIMTGTVITNDIKIGRGVLINLNCTIGHDSLIGDFVELSPGVHVSGNCKIGSYTVLGTNSTLLPGIELGSNVIVGAGAVVTKNIPSNSLVVGIPGTIIKTLEPLKY